MELCVSASQFQAVQYAFEGQGVYALYACMREQCVCFVGRAFLSNLLCASLLLSLMQREAVSDQMRLKVTALALRPIEYPKECRALLDAIKAYDGK